LPACGVLVALLPSPWPGPPARPGPPAWVAALRLNGSAFSAARLCALCVLSRGSPLLPPSWAAGLPGSGLVYSWVLSPRIATAAALTQHRSALR
jgi:hypothetical protein